MAHATEAQRFLLPAHRQLESSFCYELCCGSSVGAGQTLDLRAHEGRRGAETQSGAAINYRFSVFAVALKHHLIALSMREAEIFLS